MPLEIAFPALSITCVDVSGHVSDHRGSKGVHLATWEVEPTMPTLQCRRQSSRLVSDHRGSKGVHLATWEVEPTMPTLQCRRQSSRLSVSPRLPGRACSEGS